jgi:hypothetical protein
MIVVRYCTEVRSTEYSTLTVLILYGVVMHRVHGLQTSHRPETRTDECPIHTSRVLYSVLIQYSLLAVVGSQPGCGPLDQ